MYKRFDIRLSPLHIQLDSTIVEIADATHQIAPGGGSCRKRAKSYPLDPTSHENARSNRQFIGRLSHLPLQRSVSATSHVRVCSADILTPLQMRHAFYISARTSVRRHSFPYTSLPTRQHESILWAGTRCIWEKQSEPLKDVSH